MKLTREHFDNMELFDPIPEGMTQDEFYVQARAFIAEDRAAFAKMTPRDDELVPWDKRRREVMATIRRNQKDEFHFTIAQRLQQYDDAGVLYREISPLPKKMKRKLERIRKKYKGNMVPGIEMDPLFSEMLELSDDEDAAFDMSRLCLPKDVAPRTKKKYSKK